MTQRSNENESETNRKLASRWRVIIVRLDDAVRARIPVVYPAIRKSELTQLPTVVRSTSEPAVAMETAEGLRSMGAVVIVSEEPASLDNSAYCQRHRSSLAIHWCQRCRKPMCLSCIEDSYGEPYCRDCAAEKLSPRRRVRLRQLFALFLFSVFVFYVYDYLKTESEGANPNGLVRVGILQFVPPSRVDAEILRTLNGLDRTQRDGTSLHDIAPWFNRERARYGGNSQPYMLTEILGPWAVDVEPPSFSDESDGILSLLYGAWRYKRSFVSLADRLDVDLEDYGVRVFLVYQDGRRDLASHSMGSQRGHLAVPYVGLDESNPGYAVVTVAHEIGHALGAADTYDPTTGLATIPGGFITPHGTELYPQRFAELMSPDVPISPGEEQEVESLYQVKVGHQTASQMRWITEEEADAFYAGPTGVEPETTSPGSEDQASESETIGGEPTD